MTISSTSAFTLCTLGMLIAACFSGRALPTENLAGECRVPLNTNLPGSTIVVIRNFAFEPATVRVKRGGAVTWVNCDETGQPAHTATADAGQWDSGTLTSGGAYTASFTQAGTFRYHCEPHPFMTATVEVTD